MNLPLLQQAIAVLACVVILIRAEPALNRMGKGTPFMIRLSIHLLAFGALAEAGCIVFSNEVPGWPAVILSAGVAALLFCDRRLRMLCQQPRKREIC